MLKEESKAEPPKAEEKKYTLEDVRKLKGNGKSVPPLAAIKTPLRDGDLERPDDPAYAGAYFINANNQTAPGIVDADRQPILERREVYSGVYGSRDSLEWKEKASQSDFDRF